MSKNSREYLENVDKVCMNPKDGRRVRTDIKSTKREFVDTSPIKNADERGSENEGGD